MQKGLGNVKRSGTFAPAIKHKFIVIMLNKSGSNFEKKVEKRFGL